MRQKRDKHNKTSNKHIWPLSIARKLALTALALGYSFTSRSNSAFKTANKKKEFIIKHEPDGSTEARAFLGTAWRVDEKHPNFIDKEHPAPKPTFMAVYSDNVYGINLNSSWMGTDFSSPKTEPDLKALSPLLKNLKSEITAYHMEGAGDLMTLAFRNLTLLTIDMTQSQFGNGRVHIMAELDLRAELKIVNRRVEREANITSIGRVPYTNTLLFAPSYQGFSSLIRYRITPWKNVDKGQNPIDVVKFVVTPLQTTLGKDDPYNPKKFYGKWNRYRSDSNSYKFYQLRSQTTIVALTSANTEFTALVDYSTLLFLDNFSVRKDREKYDNPSEYVVTSICFYGAVPGAHIFALMTKHTNKQIVLFDGSSGYTRGSST